MCNRKRRYALCFFWLALLIFLSPSIITAGRVVRVGVYQNPPLVSYQEGKAPAGLYIDLIEYVAQKEGWELEYKPCMWKDCLKMLEEGKTDVQTAIGYSEERAKRFLFTDEDVLVNWAHIYRRRGEEINSIPDLQGKRVAILEGDIYEGSFLELLKSFGLTPSVMKLQSYDDILLAVSQGRADAGLVNRLYGRMNGGRFPGVEPTHIALFPIRIKFALTKWGGGSREIKVAIDKHLAEMKKSTGSLYYQSLDRWLGVPEKAVIPSWLRWVLLGSGVLIVLFLLNNCLLRFQVRLATREIREQYAEIEVMRDYLQGIYDATPDMVFVYGEDGRIKDINRRVEEVYGFSLEEFQGLPPQRMMGEGYTLEMALERIRAAMEGTPQEFRWVGRKKTGEEFPVEVRLRGVEFRRAGKTERGVIAFVRDLTEVESLAGQLSESESLREAILSAIPDLVFVLDMEGRFLDYRGGDEKELYAPPEMFIGKNIRDVLPSKVVTRAFEAIERIKAGEGLQSVEYSLPINGRLRHYEARLVPSGAEKVVAIVRDFTQEKERETALNEYRESLEEMVEKRTEELNERIREVELLNKAMITLLEDFQAANRKLEKTTEKLMESNAELEAFAYSVSHDLRAPLRAMQGFSDALIEDFSELLGETGREYARRIKTAAMRMDELITDLLEYSRMTRREVRLKPVSIEKVIAEQIEAQRDLITRSGAVVEVVEGNPPEVMGSYSILSQVVGNLLSNALKFTRPDEPPRVRIRCEERGDFVRLYFEDNGIGIPEEHAERIFRVFERLHGIEEYPGTGIGLAIVKKGVERMGGSVGVESEVGKGSIFWIDLVKYDTEKGALREGKGETR